MSDNDKEAQGVKSWMAKKAVHLLADAIRHGGKAVHTVIGYLDDKAARVFHKHSGRIADGLDDIARIPDITVNVVGEKILYFMTGQLGISYGTVQLIRKAIEGVLWTLM